MKRLLVFVFCLTVGWQLVQAQTPPQLDYTAFKERTQHSGDTLVLYNFWATWCKPCVEELPYFAQLQEAYNDQPVKIILVSLDFDRMNEKLVPFLQEKNISLPVWHLTDLDYNSWIAKVNEKWDGAIPATWAAAIAADKTWFHGGEFTYEELSTWVSEILAEI